MPNFNFIEIILYIAMYVKWIISMHNFNLMHNLILNLMHNLIYILMHNFNFIEIIMYMAMHV